MTRRSVAFVTGGSSGIGLECVKLFLEQGYQVAIADRNIETSKQLSRDAEFFKIDVASQESVDKCINAVLNHFGHIDVAVHCAGIGGPFVPANEISLKDWQQVVDIDLTGTFLVTKALCNYWLTAETRTLRHDVDLGMDPVVQKGALVNISSITGLLACHNMGALSAAKHGASGISKNFALEFAQKGIRINTVNPSVVYTPIMQIPGFNLDAAKAALSTQAMQRFCHPQEIAHACVWLCSDEASFVTGTELRLDGGLSAH